MLLIHKKGSKCDPRNYRPVSLTSVVCKLLEKHIKKAIFKHLIRHNLLSDCQYGFCEHRSTVLQLLDVLEDWTSALDDNYQVDAIYFDFAKAFDTVPHQRLLTKLQSYGIAGNLLDWIESFVYNRQQRVVINGCKSSWTEVKSGMPQGLILGPVLFVLFINDMPDRVNSACRLFADDTKLYRVVSSQHDQNSLQSDIASFCQWSKDWLLKFNSDKCKAVQYGKHNFNSQCEMSSSDGTTTIIQTAESEKDLGVHFTDMLKFDKH